MTATAPRDVPIVEPTALTSLADDLAALTVDTVHEAMGELAAAALRRDDPVPARRCLHGRREPAAVLARLWLLGDPVTRRELNTALARTTTAGAEQLGLVRAAGQAADDEVLACVDLRPLEADGATWWLTSDLAESVVGPLPEDHVLGLGGASTTLASWTPRAPVACALDVGTGSGVQALYLARHCARVTATDVSRRALGFARFNSALNARAGGPFAGRELDLRHGNLLEPVAGERFELVVSNPPFVITPRGRDGVPRYEYRDGGMVGDAVVATMARGIGDVLAPGGVGQLLGNWEHRAGEGWRDRVQSWLPDEVDACCDRVEGCSGQFVPTRRWRGWWVPVMASWPSGRSSTRSGRCWTSLRASCGSASFRRFATWWPTGCCSGERAVPAAGPGAAVRLAPG